MSPQAQSSSSSSNLHLDLPQPPKKIITTSPSPSSSGSNTLPSTNAHGHTNGKSLLFENTPYPTSNTSITLNSPSPSKLNIASTNGNGLTKTPSELDLSRTPPPRTFAPSPPPPISRCDSETDINMHINVAPHDNPLSTIGIGKVKGISKRYKDESELSRLMRTVDFAARKHSCQRRKDVDQTPYINHPIAVANYLSSTGITDVRVLQAAVLHDTVEDTHTTIEEIAQLFGTDVARIVDECTDDTSLSGLERKTAQLKSAPFKSREAQQVKLADKIHNLESIRRCPPVGWGIKRIQAYFIWAKQVTDVCAPAHPPLAEKLQELYETAYTRVDGVYHPCHPGVCGPLTEPEKDLVDSRLRELKKGDKVCPAPLFF
ncbi:hypothetical protein I302_106637 [Kwoniella bestiolae CBS 10118]|uniref:Guanosine-3',5'-bis(diphosphate) 3'-pyrophosphohydrolase MESH1 n=1 Tax=Kwoniella bestiolae CBS 10118 TaxID=1296100 RepID=A0A1B9G0V4_9TREE|nr:hypothetical protein I302_06101 [Kwoniella bestiolae CBS 10118]OCF24640.1 hypothetical protein I302_06101 [Kwoniella bestiolae CBS 10118]